MRLDENGTSTHNNSHNVAIHRLNNDKFIRNMDIDHFNEDGPWENLVHIDVLSNLAKILVVFLKLHYWRLSATNHEKCNGHRVGKLV